MFSKILDMQVKLWLLSLLSLPVYAGTASSLWQGSIGNNVSQSGALPQPGYFNPFLPPSTDAFTLTGNFFQGTLGLSISNPNLQISNPATATDPTLPFLATSTGYNGMMTATGFAHETGQVDASGYPVFTPNTDFKFTLTLSDSMGELDFPAFKIPGYQHWNFYPGSTDFMPIGTVLHYSYEGEFTLFDNILKTKLGRITGSLDMKIVSIHGDSLSLAVTDKPVNWFGFQRLFYELDLKGSPNHRGIADAAFVLPKNFALGLLSSPVMKVGNAQMMLGALADASPIDPGKNNGKTDQGKGDPISAATGNNFSMAADYAGVGVFPLSFTRFYNSQILNNGALGVGWSHSYSASIAQLSATEMQVNRPDGKFYRFFSFGGPWRPDADVNATLELVNGVWRFTTEEDNVEIYDASGKLLSIANRAGVTQNLNYDASGRLTAVNDAFGRSLSFSYDGQNRLNSFSDPAGGYYSYIYDANNNLKSVSYPDSKTRSYFYDNPLFPNALTSIVDENGTRFVSWTYDGQGRAVQSVNAGGVYNFTFNYATGSTAVTDPLGAARTYTYQTILGVPQTIKQSLPCAGCSNDASAFSYDSNGNPASRVDFNGNKTVYLYDLTRNLEISRTEAVGTPLERTITTQWHPSYRLPTQISEPNRVTTFSYNNGNLTQRTVTADKQSRTWRYQYNAKGQVTQADGPRTDVSDVTQYAYDAQGNLISTTDALGHITKITAYDSQGRPLTTVDSNGLTTQLKYVPGGRLISRNVGGELTAYQYDGIGQLIKTTFPDSRFLAYNYDNAHRLIGISDQLGNQLQYTLDGMGNRIRQDVLDPSQTLSQTLQREYNALSRLSQSIGALANEITTYGYDNNGNLTGITDALGHKTTRSYDALNRLIVSTDPLGHSTGQQYDANNNLTAVTDPKALITQYLYDGLGNRIETISPDTNTSQRSYDEAGNVLTAIDSRGKQIDYSYDALNRLTQVRYAGGIINYSYDQGTNGIGRLVQMSDGSGTTLWNYDSHGRVIKKTLQFGNLSWLTQYAYNSVGRLISMTYPSGQVIQYNYNNGLMTELDANGKPLLNNIQYQPFGPAHAWNWGNGATYNRVFDLDGRLAQYPLGSRTRQLSFDAAGRIGDYLDSELNHSQHFGYDELARLIGFTTTGIQDTYRYDANGNRLSLSQVSGTTDAYSYAQDSNKLTAINTTGGTSVYSYDAAGNTLADGKNQFSYDGRGRLTLASNIQGFSQYRLNGQGQRVAKAQGAPLDLAGDADQDGQLTAVDQRLIALMVQGKSPVNLSGDCNRDNLVTLQDVACVQAKILDLRQNPNKYWQNPTYFVYDQAGHLLGEYNQAGQAIQETVYLSDMPVVTLVGGQAYYIYTDHLNTPRAIADNTSTVVWRWDSNPFGTTLSNEDPDGNGQKFRNNLRFPGQYYDAETGKHYNYFRDYDPRTGRYIESDPIGLEGGINTYVYALSNSVSLQDLRGEDPTPPKPKPPTPEDFNPWRLDNLPPPPPWLLPPEPAPLDPKPIPIEPPPQPDKNWEIFPGDGDGGGIPIFRRKF